MIFSSNTFLFLFLPVCLLAYQAIARFGRRARFGFLVLASLVFYSYWDPHFFFVLAGSMVMNFLFMKCIARAGEGRAGQLWVVLAIAANLGLLIYFKYLFPVLGWTYAHGVTHHFWHEVALPLGISFFTFTQIAYLIDLQQGTAEAQDFLGYALFVTFFPHLIAGPIIHHREMMPQFNDPKLSAEQTERGLLKDDLVLGFTWFTMGMVKKVLIADSIANLPNEFYAHPHDYGFSVGLLAVLAYAMQLYFDFSGYSDMALGLARMFSIRFPLNFHSPYKATSIIDFWQRWHMTLTRYLTLYLYNPIALHMNRRRAAAGRKVNRKATRSWSGFAELIFIPIFITMFLAGIWHGAGMQFILFGVAHGIYLSINHAWRVVVPEDSKWQKLLPAPVCVAMTFVSVLVAQVFFRANSASDAFYILATLAGRHGGFHLQHQVASVAAGVMANTHEGAIVIAALLIICWTMPNTQEILGQLPSDLKRTFSLLPRFHWTPSPAWAFALSILLARTVSMLDASTSFLYFQF